jgi:hypothetical protein
MMDGAHFSTVAADLVARDERVEQGTMLHSPGLKTSGKFFVFATPDDIVVKLSAVRVQELIASGVGRPCQIGNRGPMREWVRLTPGTEEACATYVMEGRDFVAGAQGRRRLQSR